MNYQDYCEAEAELLFNLYRDGEPSPAEQELYFLRQLRLAEKYKKSREGKKNGEKKGERKRLGMMLVAIRTLQECQDWDEMLDEITDAVKAENDVIKAHNRKLRYEKNELRKRERKSLSDEETLLLEQDELATLPTDFRTQKKTLDAKRELIERLAATYQERQEKERRLVEKAKKGK